MSTTTDLHNPEVQSDLHDHLEYQAARGLLFTHDRHKSPRRQSRRHKRLGRVKLNSQEQRLVLRDIKAGVGVMRISELLRVTPNEAGRWVKILLTKDTRP